MYCRNCGSEMDPQAAVCVACGFPKGKGTKFCGNCGKETQAEQAFCLNCGHGLSSKGSASDPSRGGSFVRVAEGKIISGVCTGIGKACNISPWVIRAILLILPLWPIWAIGYIVLSASFPME